MRLRWPTLVLLAGSLALVGCATKVRSPDASGTAATVRAPGLLSSARTDWRMPSAPRDGRVLDLRVAVQIDSAGQPDLSTLRVTGLGASENRDAAATWVRNSRFRPAEQAGRAVPGLFEARFAARARVQRVRGA
jgi:hypothetical protein